MDMSADLLRTTINIFRGDNMYQAVCLTCGTALARSPDPAKLCAADRAHMCFTHREEIAANWLNPPSWSPSRRNINPKIWRNYGH